MAIRKYYLSWLRSAMITCLCLCAWSAHAETPAETNRPLTFGILPFSSPLTLFKRFAPLTEHLSQQLGRPIKLESARDFDTFVQRTQARHYDLVMTAPHFVLLALDAGYYEARAIYSEPLYAIIAVRQDSPIRSIKELHQGKISTPSAFAAITLAGRHYLQSQGLSGDDSPRYVHHKTHDASLYAMLGRETDAAIASINVVNRHLAQGHSLRILDRSSPLPGMGILVAKDLPDLLKHQIEELVVNLQRNPEGQAILKKIQYPGYRKIKDGEFEAVRNFLSIKPDITTQ